MNQVTGNSIFLNKNIQGMVNIILNRNEYAKPCLLSGFYSYCFCRTTCFHDCLGKQIECNGYLIIQNWSFNFEALMIMYLDPSQMSFYLCLESVCLLYQGGLEVMNGNGMAS